MDRKALICSITIANLVTVVILGYGIVTESVPAFEQPSSTIIQGVRPEGWTDETHSNKASPNYEMVFPQDKVNKINITIYPENWKAMQANMKDLFGEKRGEITQQVNTTSENPMWVPATLEFNGLTWTHVGVRYKGDSSLWYGWNSGTPKLSLKFEFDEFEDEYPEIHNQRFYGFKQLSLSNGFADSTYMRDVIATYLLAEAGLPAAKASFYEIIMDYGEGPVNLGLYIMIEVIDDTVIGRFFGSDYGNIYDGEKSGVSLAKGTFNQIKDSFQKENNRGIADWSDIEELYRILHSSDRISDPEEWRKNLESIFNVDAFLEWLAISAIMQHWDSYGQIPHNFYLYNDPDTGQITWISWDHNMILTRPPSREDMRLSISLGKEEVGQNWPLIRFMLDDPVYYNRYFSYMEKAVNSIFDPEQLEKKCWELADLITPYTVKESRYEEFESAVKTLTNRIYKRYQIATDFLETGTT